MHVSAVMVWIRRDVDGCRGPSGFNNKTQINLSDIVKGTYHYGDTSSVAMFKTFQA